MTRSAVSVIDVDCVKPLLGLGDPELLAGLFFDLPDMYVFSSDFAHGEGNADPIRSDRREIATTS